MDHACYECPPPGTSIEGSKKLLHVLYQVAIPVLMTQAHGFMNARVHTQNKVNTMG